MIEARFIIDQGYERSRAQSLRCANPRRYYQPFWAIGGILLGIAYGFLGGFTVAPIGLVALAVFALCLELWRRLQNRQAFRASALRGEEAVWHFEDTCIRLQVGESKSQISWKHIHNIVVAADGILIFSNPRMYQFVPTNAFKNSDMRHAVHALFFANKTDGEKSAAQSTTGSDDGA